MSYVSAKELADMKISGLPETRQKIQVKAKRENWQGRNRKAKGGGLEYCIATLPDEIRQAIEQQQLKTLRQQVAEQEFELSGSLNAVPEPKMKKSRANPKGLPTVHRPEDSQLALDLDNPDEAVKYLNRKQKDCADARMGIVADILTISDVHQLPLKRSVAFFLEQMRTGELPSRIAALIPIANARNNGVREVSVRTLMAWIGDFKAAGSNKNARLLALAPKATNVERSPFDVPWLARFANIHRVGQKPKLVHSYEKFVQQWLADGLPENELPSLDVVRRVWNKLPQIYRESGRRTGAQLKSIMPYIRRDWSGLSPNQVWIMDGHSFKARVRHFEHGQPFVPEITFVIDGCTRKIVGFSVALSESSKAVADAMRMGLRHGGLPVLVYSDNGKGETGRDITGELTGLCPRLDITHKTGIAGNPQGRGIIEGVWDNTLIKLAKTYPTYHGKDMDKSLGHLIYRKTESWAKAERDGKLLTDEQRKYKDLSPTWERFFADLLHTIDEYNHRPNRALPKQDGVHFSPADYWAFRMAQVPIDERPEILSESELQLLEHSMVERVPSRGWIQFNHQGYFNAELAKFNGIKVLVAYDWDRAQEVGVYQQDGRFICMAILNGNTRDAFQDVKSMAQTQREKRAKKQITLKQNQIKRLQMDMNGGNVIENRPDFAALAAPQTVANDDFTVPSLADVEVLDVEVEAVPHKKKYFGFGS